MCVIAYQPAGKTLDRELAKAMWKKNPDGGGFAFRKQGKLEVVKTMNFTNWWSLYRNYTTAYPESDFLIHMRIGTQGNVDVGNAHPFVVSDTLVMAHNGHIDGCSSWNKAEERSDTRIFVEQILPNLHPLWLDDPFMCDFMEDAIGGSKLAFLNTDPNLDHEVYILNDHRGDWLDGFWFSNSLGLKDTAFYKQHGKAKWYSNKNTYYSTGKVETGTKATYAETYKEADQLYLARKSFGFGGHLEVLGTGHIVCTRCGFAVTLEKAHCMCYDMICDTCEDFLAMCPCEPQNRQIRELDTGEVPRVEKEFVSSHTNHYTEEAIDALLKTI